MKTMLRRGTALALFALLLAAALAGCGGSKGFRQIGMDEAQKLIEAGTDALIVDVRTQEEYDKGHIPGAILLPIEDIREGKLDKLPDRDRELLLYCWTGRRSEDSAAILVDEGYTNVTDIGGFVDWKGAVEGGEAQENAK